MKSMWSGGIVSIAGFAVALLASQVVQASSGTWNSTGASRNAFWTNSSNWSASPYPSATQTATFNNSGNTNTTINVDGLASISNITFDTSSAAGYTIGSNGVNQQTVVLWPNSFIQLTASTVTNERFDASLQLGFDKAGTTHTFVNSNLISTLTFAGDVLSLGSGSSAGTKALVTYGAGNIAFLGNIISNGQAALTITDNGTGKLTLSGSNVITTLAINGAPSTVIDIGSGYLSLDNKGGQTINSTQGGVITGTGKIRLSMNGTTGTDYADNSVSAGKTLVIYPSIIGDTGFEMYSTLGTFIFGGINLFTKDVRIGTGTSTGGTLGASKIGNRGSTTSNFGQGTNIIFEGNCRLLYFGAGEVSDRIIIMNNHATLDQSGSGNLNFSASPTLSSGGKLLTLQGSTAGTGELSGMLSNGGGGPLSILKQGTGTWVLSTNNTYSGATTISNGVLSIAGAGGAITSAVTVAGGAVLSLDNTATANNTNRLSNIATLAMYGGTLRFVNSGGAANYSESVGPLAVVQNANTVLSSQAAAGQTSTLTFSALSRTAGATVNFAGAGLGSADGRNKIVIAGQAAGIIGPWATVNGTNLAAYSATLGVYASPEPTYNQLLAAYGPSTITDNPTDNVSINTQGTGGDIALGANPTRITSLVQNTVYDAVVKTAGSSLELSAIAIPAGNAGVTVGATSGDGTLKALASGGDVLLINNGAAALVVNAVVTNNGTASTLTKMGSGSATLAGANTFSGATTIGGGALVLANSDALQNSTLASGGVVFDSSVVSQAFSVGGLSGSFNEELSNNSMPPVAVALTVGKGNNNTIFSGVLSGVGASVTKVGNGTLTLSGSNTFSGGITVSQGALTAASAGSLGAGPVVNNGTLNLTAPSDVTYTGLSSGMSGTGTVNVTLGSGGSSVFLNGNYAGFTGVWNIGVGAAAGAAKIVMNGSDNSSMTFNVLSNGTLYSSAGTHAANLVLKGGDTGESYGQLRLDSGATWAGPITLAGTISSAGDGIVGSASGIGYITGTISDLDSLARPFTKMSAGTIVLASDANTYKGQTWIRDGVLRVLSMKNVGASNSALGAPANLTDATVKIGNNNTNATLTYFGMGDVSDRVLELAGTTDTVTLDQSGTNLWKLTGGMRTTLGGNKTLTFQGSTIGAGEFSGAISNGAGSMIALNKAGTGMWTLSGDNSYTGNTTLSSGTLVLAHPHALGTNNWVLMPNTVGTLDFANNGVGETPYSFQMNAGTVATLRSNRDSAGDGINHALNEMWLSGVTVNFTNGANVVSGTPTFSVNLINLWSGSAGSVSVVSPIGVNLAVGTVTIYSNNVANKAIQLDGTSLGNVITGSISNGLNAVLLTKSNASTWTLLASNSYSGATTINRGSLVLAGADGRISGTSGFTLQGGTLCLSNSAVANNTDRLRDSAPIAMSGGALRFEHDADATVYSETAGALTVNSAGLSANTVAASPAGSGGASTLTFASLAQGAGGAVNFSGTGLGDANLQNRITFTTPPTLVNGLIGPWAYYNGSMFASYDNALGVVPAGDGVYTNIAAKGPSVIPNNAAFNARITDPGVDGAITLESASADSVYTLLQDTPWEATVGLTNGQSLLTTAVIVGANRASLTIGTNTNDGLVMPLSAGGSLLLGNFSTNALTINAPVANNASASSLIKVGDGTARLGGLNTFSGPVAIHGGTLTFSCAQTQSVFGVISGAGGLTMDATGGRINLNNANTYDGVTTISKGVLWVSNNLSLGSTVGNTVISNGATLDVGSPTGGNGLDLGAEEFIVGGSGVNGRGAIINSSAQSQYSYVNRVTLYADTTFGGENASARWDMRNNRSSIRPLLTMNDFNITKVGSNMVVLTSISVNPGTGSVDIVQGGLSAESSTTMGGSSTNVMMVENGAYFDYYNLTAPISWALVVNNGGRIYSRSGNATNLNVWLGPVTVNGTALLDGASSTAENFNGVIGGGSIVKMGGSSITYLNSLTNTYSGNTIVSNGTLYAYYAGSLPGYDVAGKVTVVGSGTLAVSTGNGVTGWNSDQVNALHVNATPLSNTAVIQIDAVQSPLPDLHDITKPYAFVKNGTNWVTVSGSNSMGAITVSAGLLTFGAGSSNTVGASVSIRGGGAGATMIANGLFAQTATNLTVTVGSANADRSVFAFSTNVVSGKFIVGNAFGAAGAVIQNGGLALVDPKCASTEVLTLGGNAGYGYYRMNGGALRTGQLSLTGAGSGANNAVVDIYDGNVGVGTNTVQAGWLIWGWAGGSGVLNLFNGSIVTPTANDATMGYAANRNTVGMLNLLGTGASFDCTGLNVNRGLELAKNGGNQLATVNLNAGVLTANRILASASTTPTFFNFDGGTLRARTGTTYASTFMQKLWMSTIYSGGATFDTTNASITVNQPLSAPSGYGVAYLPMVNGGAGYIGAPVVSIAGGSGTGATAIATVDLADGSPTKGQITGLIVTSHGVGYQYGEILSVTLAGGGFTVAALPGTPILGINALTGGLTKVGSGTLTLGATNTYAGATVISNGTVKLGNAYALPSATDVVLAGGTLDLNGFTVTNNLMGTLGTLTNGTVYTVISPAGTNVIGTETLTLNSANVQGAYLADVAADGTSDLLTIQNGFNLGNLTLQIVDPMLLNRSKSYTVATVNGGMSGALVATNLLDSRWHVVYGVDGTVKLVFVDGTLMFLK